jgi:FCD domain
MAGTAPGTRDDVPMTEDATISLLSDATHIACRRMTPQHLDALHACVDQASCLPARPDWGSKATAHLELFAILGDLTGDSDLSVLVSSATRRLHELAMTVGPAADGIILSSRRRLLSQLRAWNADGAALEMERHLERLHFMERLAGGADPGRMTVRGRAKVSAGGRQPAPELLVNAGISSSSTPSVRGPRSTSSSGYGDSMEHMEADIEDAARRFERLADDLAPAQDRGDLRAIVEATAQVRRDEALVMERVAAARARGRTWNGIAGALGVSRQAARHRFADKLD